MSTVTTTYTAYHPDPDPELTVSIRWANTHGAVVTSHDTGQAVLIQRHDDGDPAVSQEFTDAITQAVHDALHGTL